MTQPAKVQEPSMEEILASIRRIIADDEAKPPAGAEKPAASGEAGSTKPSLQADKPNSAVQASAKAPPSRAICNIQSDIDAMLDGFDVPRPAAGRPSTDTEVLELTDEMALPTDSFNKIEPEDDLEINEAAAAAQRREPTAAKPRDPAVKAAVSADAPMPSSAQQMLSRTTVSAVESAFNTLANTVLSNNARTLEDLVKEMLRPLLKSWLDDNLPGVVERIVKAEIERVSRGR